MYNAPMSKENQDSETMKEDEKNCSQDCSCGAPEDAEKEYAEAVDEQDAAQAEAATDDLTKWRELAMRTAAEYDNYRKRCVKDREEFTRYANRGLLEELLPVIDNFEMGMMMAGQDTTSMIYIGMSMVQKQLADFLSSQGWKPSRRRWGRCLTTTSTRPSRVSRRTSPQGPSCVFCAVVTT